MKNSVFVLVDERDCFQFVDRATFERDGVDPSIPLTGHCPPGFIAIPRAQAQEMIAAVKLVRAMRAKGLLTPKAQHDGQGAPDSTTSH